MADVTKINGYNIKDTAARTIAETAQAAAEAVQAKSVYTKAEMDSMLGDLSGLGGYIGIEHTETGAGSYVRYDGQLPVPDWFNDGSQKTSMFRKINLSDSDGNRLINGAIDKIGVFIPVRPEFFTNNPTVQSVQIQLFAGDFSNVSVNSYYAYRTGTPLKTMDVDVTERGIYYMDTSDVDFSAIESLAVGFNVTAVQYTDGTTASGTTSKIGLGNIMSLIYISRDTLLNNPFYQDTEYYAIAGTNTSFSGYNWTKCSTSTDTAEVVYAELLYYKAADNSNIDKEINVSKLLKLALDGTGANTPLGRFKYDGGMANIFKRISCIGDSLTSGVCEFKDENGSNNAATSFTEYAYPAHMSRVLGIECKNLGAGGRTAANRSAEQLASGVSKYSILSWLYNARNVKEYWHDNETDKSDAYIIALGTNDIANYGSFTGDLSTDADIDVSAKSITVNDNTTSVGGYCEIVNAVTAVQPRARIFCVTLPNTRESDAARSEMNTKIKAIADAYKSIGTYIYVIDLETHGVSKEDAASWKAVYYSGGHLNPLGYKWIADAYMTYIDYIITNNPAEFKGIHVADDLTRTEK